MTKSIRIFCISIFTFLVFAVSFINIKQIKAIETDAKTQVKSLLSSYYNEGNYEKTTNLDLSKINISDGETTNNYFHGGAEQAFQRRTRYGKVTSG